MARLRGIKRPRRQSKEPNIVRGVADELGITTPKEAERPRRKGPMRPKDYHRVR